MVMEYVILKKDKFILVISSMGRQKLIMVFLSILMDPIIMGILGIQILMVMDNCIIKIEQ